MDRACKLCKLGCGKAVPGFGPTKPKLIVVSDYPGRTETEQGQPLVGRSGQLLRKALTNIVGLDPDNEVFYTNVIRCEPQGDATKLIGRPEISACRRWMVEDFSKVDCNTVLIAGGLAFETLLSPLITMEKQKDKEFNHSRAHGRVFRYLGKTYLVTWNPAFVEQYKFKKITSDAKGRTTYVDWFPTGSVPWFFIQDLKKLKELII